MTDTTTALLEGRDLGFSRNDRKLFTGVDFSLQAGEILQVEGSNGSGKTTLLRLLCGFSPIQQGDLRWNGQPIGTTMYEYAQELAYVGHAPGIKDELTPLENLTITQALIRKRPDVEECDVLARLGIKPAQLDTPCRQLSAGQRRRVALARLLIGQARLWVLDEPFTALDPQGRKLIEALMVEHAQAGGMVILTTHHAMRLGDCPVHTLDLSS